MTTGPGDQPADFGKTYWRTRTVSEAVLPALDPAHLDDAAFRLLADNLPTLCWIANGDGYIVWYNRRWYDYTGTTPGQMEGWGWTAVHDPHCLPDVMERWRAAIAEGEPFEMTFPLRGADGMFRPFLTRIVPVRDATGGVARWCGVNTKIANQVAAEQALRESEERLRGSEARYRGIVEGAEDFAIVSFDEHGIITSWNSGAERLLGFAEAEAVGRPGDIFFTPEDRDAGIPDHEMNRAATAGRAVDERWHQKKDGSRFWGSGLMMGLDGGGYLKIFRDRTIEHQAEAALRESEARYRTLFESIDAGFCVVEVLFDADGRACDYRYLEANPALEAQTGLTDVVGRTALEVMPNHEQLWIDLYGQVATTGEPAQKEEGVADLDRWYDVRAFRVGRPGQNRVAVLFDDISDRRRAELALQELNRTLEQRVATAIAERDRAWNYARDIQVVVGLDGVFHAINPAWTAILGHTAAQVVGHSFLDFIHPDDAERDRSKWTPLQLPAP